MRALLVGFLLVALGAPPAFAHVSEDDCGSGRDAPVAVHAGIVIEAPGECAAHFGADDERDSFRFHAPAGVRIRVEVVPAVAGHFPNLGLFSPDHDGNGGSRLVERNNASATFVAADVDEPGFWAFYVYLQESNASGRLAHGDYRILIAIEGTPREPDAFDGSYLAGAPAGSRVDRALGPDGPEPLARIDGDWIELRATTTGQDFIQVASEACEDCLFVAYKLTSGTVFDATCQRKGADVFCMPFPGVTHVLVHGGQGTQVAFTLGHWHP